MRRHFVETNSSENDIGFELNMLVDLALLLSSCALQ